MLVTLLMSLQLFNFAAFKAPVIPSGEGPDLRGYKEVVFDDFNGDALNEDIWFYRGEGRSRCGYHAGSQVSVKDGNMILSGEYLDADEGKFGEGWYSGCVALKEKYLRGYFEIRCICNSDKGFWSAFWIQADHPYDERSKGGVEGAEIDIMEAMNYNAFLPFMRDEISQTIWCNGTDDDMENLDKCCVFALGKKIYKSYNTYGLMWDENEYIFYVNGKETFRTSFGLGVSTVPEQVLVSLELPDELPKKIADNHDYKTQMTVDYVKIYQK